METVSFQICPHFISWTNFLCIFSFLGMNLVAAASPRRVNRWKSLRSRRRPNWRAKTSLLSSWRREDPPTARRTRSKQTKPKKARENNKLPLSLPPCPPPNHPPTTIKTQNELQKILADGSRGGFHLLQLFGGKIYFFQQHGGFFFSPSTSENANPIWLPSCQHDTVMYQSTIYENIYDPTKS